MKHLKDWTSPLNEGIPGSMNISVGQYWSGDEEKERKAAEEFEWSPPSEPITVESVDADITDEYNAHVEILLSNGDEIEFKCWETRRPKNPGDVPPWYDTSYKINGKAIPLDMDVFFESSNTLVGSILDYYVTYQSE